MSSKDQPMDSQMDSSPSKLIAGNGTGPVPARPAVLKWMWLLLPLAYLWFRLIDNLRFEWTTNPQYGYGWLVPLLCVGLLMRRWQFLPREPAAQPAAFAFILLFAFFASLYLPTRLIEAAIPEWRPIQWSLGVEAVGLTLCTIYLGRGRDWLRQLAFPICFFFVAIPWPTLIETPIIQTLTRVSAAIVIELLGWVGVPALVHGNVIEVSTGMVGIDEACSGIRSFQSSLMISLFLGEFYRLSPLRRWLLVPMGFLLSMAFNICRMSLLTLIAAKKGVAAISEYHDPAGVTIAVLCTLALWALAVWLKNPTLKSHIQKPPSPGNESSVEKTHRPSVVFPFIQRLGLILIVWLVVVEAGVQIWYRSREARLKAGPDWSLNFPRDNPTLKDLPMDAATRYLLRFDEGKQAGWTESDGTLWQGFYFSWSPGRVAGYLAKRHTPEICFTATGARLISGPKLTMMNIHGVELPIRSYTFESDGQLLQVFHCRWEAGMESDAYVTHESARYNLIRAIWAGRGNKGQKVLEFVVSGMEDPEQAKAALAQQLEKLIQVESPKRN
jgi:exosortase